MSTEKLTQCARAVLDAWGDAGWTPAFDAARRALRAEVEAAEALAAVPVEPPAAWQVWWGLGYMRLNSVHIERKTAEEAAATIKSYTEIRPLYAHPAPQPQQASDWRTPTTQHQRMSDAVTLLCAGKRPDDAMVQSWLDGSSEDLQSFAANHGPAWAQGIGLLDAASLMADHPTEGVEHEIGPKAQPQQAGVPLGIVHRYIRAFEQCADHVDTSLLAAAVRSVAGKMRLEIAVTPPQPTAPADRDATHPNPQALEEQQTERCNCLAAGPTATDLALWTAMNEAEKHGLRTDDKLIRKALNDRGYYLVRSLKKPGTCEYLLAAHSAPAPQAQAVSQWQGIESAPKDGRLILVDFPTKGVRAVFWGSPFHDEVTAENGIWCVDDDKHGPYGLRGYNDEGPTAPTHWQPMPVRSASASQKEPT